MTLTVVSGLASVNTFTLLTDDASDVVLNPLQFVNNRDRSAKQQ